MGAGGREPVVQHGPPDVPGRGGTPGRVDGVPEEHTELLGGPLLAEPPGGLVRCRAVDGVAGHIDRGFAIGDPVGHHVADPPSEEDAQRVETGGHEEVVQLRSRTQQGVHVGGERLGTAEELPDAGVGQRRHPLHGHVHERGQPVDVRRELPEGEVLGHAVECPGRGLGFEQPDQEPVTLGSEVAVAVRVLDDRQVTVDSRHGLGDQVVVLSRLQGHFHPGECPELA